jgi:hypothetical protein
MIYETELIKQIITSEKAKEILSFVSPIYGKATIALSIFNTIGKQMDEAEAIAEDIALQMVPQTATWGLKYWEQEFMFKTVPGATIAERRQRLMAALSTNIASNPFRLKTIAETITGVPARIVENTAKNTFEIWLTSITLDETELINEINKVKPSHLIYHVKYEQIVAGTEYIGGIFHNYKYFQLRQVN